MKREIERTIIDEQTICDYCNEEITMVHKTLGASRYSQYDIHPNCVFKLIYKALHKKVDIKP